MKNLIILSLLIISPKALGKFAAYVFQIPCEKIELKVLSCQESSISNIADLREPLRQRDDIAFNYKGALIKAYPLKREPVKCNDKQKIDFKRYKQDDLKENFFIKNAKCSSDLKKITVKRFNYFCDTPGTPTIFGCYINKVEYKQNLEYTELVQKN